MPIVLSGNEWRRITQWTKTQPEEIEAAQRSAYVHSLDERSKAITKTWPDCLENIAKRNEQMKLERIAAEEKANDDFYRDYLKRRKEEHERIMQNAREAYFKLKDAPRQLISGFVESVTLKERELQIEFLNKLRREAKDRKKREDDAIIENSRAYHKFHDDKARRRREADKQYQIELLDQINETSERQRKEYEEELHRQKVDSIRAAEELAFLENFEKELKTKETARILADAKQSLKESEAKRRQRAAQDHLEDQITEVLRQSKIRIKDKRHETEKEIQKEKLRVLEAISQNLETGDEARAAEERANLEKAIRQKEEAEDRKLAAARRKKEEMRAQRIAIHEEYLKKDAQRQRDFANMKTWEMMNRYKNAEIYREYKENQRKEEERKIQQFRTDMLEQQRERKDREDAERAERRYFFGALAEKRLRDEDNRVLRYGDALLREARQHRRPEVPIHQAIDRYCQKYRLYPMPPLPRHWAQSFPHYRPVDKSRPDPSPRDAQSSSNEQNEVATKPPGNDQKPEVPNKQPFEVPKDYRYQAPANGLQTRPEKERAKLPKIRLLTCKEIKE